MKPGGKDGRVAETPPGASNGDKSSGPGCSWLLSGRRYCNLDAILANTWWRRCKVKCTPLRIIQAGLSCLLLPGAVDVCPPAPGHPSRACTLGGLIPSSYSPQVHRERSPTDYSDTGEDLWGSFSTKMFISLINYFKRRCREAMTQVASGLALLIRNPTLLPGE